MSTDPDTDLDDLESLIEAVATNLDADLILYVGDVLSPANRELHALMHERRKRRKNVMLFLTTDGGSADVAYQIARCLQLCYKEGKFILYVNTFCKSAGTLIATGAHEVVMSDEAELGPLDVQVYKRDELGERISGLTPIQALTTLRREAFRSFEQYLIMIRVSSRFQITTMTAAQIAAKLTNGCFGPIYRQLDPMGLGEHQRAMTIANDYGERLDKGNLKAHALEQLIAGYPSHQFVIDREEATTLFHAVREPDSLELLLANCLEDEIEECIREDEMIVRFLSKAPEPQTDDGENDEKEDERLGKISPSAGANGGEAAGPDGPKLDRTTKDDLFHQGPAHPAVSDQQEQSDMPTIS